VQPPSIYELVGDAAVIDISGSLVPGYAGWMQLFGVTGYEDISGALIEAVKDKKAKRIVLCIDSPGGAVKGVSSTAELINNVGKVKPLNVYAETANSAAYWLACAGGNITLDEVGEAGSIGTLIVHTEYSKELAQEGVTKTIIRAGKYKALANPIEPLSEEAKADLQQKADDARDLFVNAVANYRGTTPSKVESSMGQGRVFMGMRALGVGLVDRIGTFQDALAYSAELAKTFVPVKTVKVV
jgi:signal peptide peptidase SppA